MAGSVAGAGPGQPQVSTGWHHFGASDNTPAAEPSESGVWRHFGTTAVVPKAVAPNPGPHESVPARSALEIADLEKQMYELVNRDRSDPANAGEIGGKVTPLKWNERLASVARAHSRAMLTQGFFAHVDPEGRSPGMRVRAAGIGWQAVGENIAIYPSVESAETAFMNEPRFEHNHRSNILGSKYTDVGVGIVQDPRGWYYITEEFLQKPIDLRASF
ncbi:MAG TPA: CAP domain-containing protein [Terriglobia bacterium]